MESSGVLEYSDVLFSSDPGTGCPYKRTPLVVTGMATLWHLIAVLFWTKVLTILLGFVLERMNGFLCLTREKMGRMCCRGRERDGNLELDDLGGMQKHAELDDSDEELGGNSPRKGGGPGAERDPKRGVAGELHEKDNLKPESRVLWNLDDYYNSLRAQDEVRVAGQSGDCNSRILTVVDTVRGVFKNGSVIEMEYNIITLTLSLFQIACFLVQFKLDVDDLQLFHFNFDSTLSLRDWHKYQCTGMVLLNSPNFKFCLTIVAIKAGRVISFPKEGIVHSVVWVIETVICSLYLVAVCAPISFTHLIPGAILYGWVAAPIGALMKFGIYMQKKQKLNNAFATTAALMFYSILGCIVVPILYEMTCRKYQGQSYLHTVTLPHLTREVVPWNPPLGSSISHFTFFWTFW